jgi:hypothetical protein
MLRRERLGFKLSRSSIQKCFHPQFKRQELPKLHRPVVPTAAVLVDVALYSRRLK